MDIYQVKNEKSITHLFKGWDETMIWSYLDGCMGQAYVDCLENPQSAQILIADFCFFAGNPHSSLVRHISKGKILVPQNKAWAQMIEDVHGENVKSRYRYATFKDKTVFDVETLENMIAKLPQAYELHAIDEELYSQIMNLNWARDLCAQFDNDDFQHHGLGYVIVSQGHILSGASTYTYYDGGIEIEIVTHPDYRQQGLASLVGAQLILACLSKGLYPSWDAHNQASLALSQKLGYIFDSEYKVYEVTN